jgi:glycosyltransferase involved in cell wall biosynthesis
LEYLIDALPHVLAQMECTLLIVGEFYYGEGACRERIEHYGVGERVRIINRYVPNEEVEIYFCAADLMVLPYVEASQSGVLQVAQSFTLPAVATQVGGLPEQISHGNTGFLVPARDSDALAKAIVAFFHEDRGKEFRKNIEQARSRYSWTRVAEAIVSLA